MKARFKISILLGLVLYLQQGRAHGEPGFLIEAAALKASLGSGVVVLDARNYSKYGQGHIEGAINAWWQDLADISGKTTESGYGVVLKKEKLAKILGGYGIDKTSKVVVYADSKDGWGEDGRIVWMLRMAGVADSKMLNGGIQAWTAKGYPTKKTVIKPVARPFSINSFDSSWTANTKWIEKNKDTVKIVDSRTKEEYDGATNFGEARGGHLPGATLIAFKSVFASDGKLKSKADLEKMFLNAGLKKIDSIVAYCTAGIRSAHMVLLLRMTGFKKARNYDASFYSWAAEDRLKVE